MSFFTPFAFVKTVGPVGPTWTPEEIPNVLYWFTSDSGTTLSGSNITAWEDQISGSISLELTGSINAPIYNSSDGAANNKPSIEFSTGATKSQGLYKYLNVSPFTTQSDMTILEAVIPSTRAVNELQASSGIMGGNGVEGFEMMTANGGPAGSATNTLYVYTRRGGDTDGGYAYGGAITAGNLIWRAIRFDSSTGVFDMYVNSTGSIAATQTRLSNPRRDRTSIGFGVYAQDGGLYSEGKILDLVYVNGYISLDDMQQYADYIAAKFG